MGDGIEKFRQVFTAHDLGFSDGLEVLRSHFELASSSHDDVVRYSRDRRDALLLRFDHKGRFTDIDVGPGLRDDDLARLIAAFTAPRLRRVMSTVIFGAVPTVGFWRYRDRFQVFPMPPKAPRPPYVIGGVHPRCLRSRTAGRTTTKSTSTVAPWRLGRSTACCQGWFAAPRTAWGTSLVHTGPCCSMKRTTAASVGNPISVCSATTSTDSKRRAGSPSARCPLTRRRLRSSRKTSTSPAAEFSDRDVLVLPDCLEACLDVYFGLDAGAIG